MFKPYWIYLALFLNLLEIASAQNPVAFQITTDEGLPNQTVYSIIQDKKGFIWAGTDAGLYKYDGIRFTEYKNHFQKSRSVTGLEETADGRIYMYNFIGQIFYIENDSLHLLTCWNGGRISNICVDHSNNLWVCHKGGINKYIRKANKWESIPTQTIDNKHTHSCYIDEQNTFWCLGATGLIKIINEKVSLYSVKWGGNKVSGQYQLAFHSDQKLIFSITDGEIFQFAAGVIKPFFSVNLNPLLKDKKITRVEQDKNNCLWIYTFNGVIIYDLKNDCSQIYYEDNALSCGITDHENSFWLSTLHDGILRIPELSYKLWSIKNEQNSSLKINKIINAESSIFFSTTSGEIGELNKKTNSAFIKSMDTKLDIQCLTITENNKSILFGVQNSVFQLEQKKLKKIREIIAPPKDIVQINNNYLIGTSNGVYWCSTDKTLDRNLMPNTWTRSILYDQSNSLAYLGTNEGIKKYKLVNNQWNYQSTILNNIQITSICFGINNHLYALTFNGKIYEIIKNDTPIHITTLDEDCSGQQIKANRANIFIATNKGLWKYDLNTKKSMLVSRLSGLASNHLNAIDIDSHFVWLATSKGIQQIPIKTNTKKTSPKIYLRNIFINNNLVNKSTDVDLDYKDELKIELNAIALSSENNFKYAYRLNNTSWIYLPGEIKQIEIPALISGPFTLEIKLLDYLGVDSDETIKIVGYTAPPFWQRWWFYLAIGVTCLLIALVIFKQRVKIIQKKQVKEVERINLEHQLKLSQETALRAQMNPHFIFNVLNSIKSYIYENDKKKAASYLQRFSDLVRKILEQSSMPWVKLDEEIELLKLYIELESMLFIDEFHYSIQIDDSIDTSHTSLPSLILQPFIENAFKHGLRHKLGKKKLEIVFAIDTINTVLNVTITDNGIGRNQSKIINDDNAKKHSSFSTRAINKVSTFNQNKPGIISITYVDLFDDDNNSIGTTVEIKIKPNE
jgi:ligand-binding sensor domain-containing protein